VTETEIEQQKTTEVEIRPRVPEDDARIVEIEHHVNPDLPPQTVEELRHRIASRPKEARQIRFVAQHAGTVVGHGALIEITNLASKNTYFGFVSVDPDRQREGIGSRLYDHLAQCLTEVGAAKIYSDFRENRSDVERFAARRGFSRTGRMDRLSRLHVPTANLEGYEGVEERLRGEGLRIATLAELGPEDDELLHALHLMEFESARDIPSSEEMTEPWPYDSWLLRHHSPGNAPERIWLAMDGRTPVGVASLYVSGSHGLNDYTGVARAYRGKGVARALKLKTIEWCRANGIESIYTGNDIDNQRMLAINIRLGYEPIPGEVEVVKELS
jgi:GNAT superfamily N-acetyltransferase